jgi:hypothetical protein
VSGNSFSCCEKNRGGKMSAWLIAVIGVVYLIVSVDLLIKGQTGLGIAFIGYAIGNVGLTLAALK